MAVPIALLWPRAVAPQTVNRPVIVDFHSVHTTRTADGETVDLEMRGRFFRDKRGYTKTEYFDPNRGQRASIFYLWNQDNRTTTIVEVPEQRVTVMAAPHIPDKELWLPAAQGMPAPVMIMKPTPTDEEKTFTD